MFENLGSTVNLFVNTHNISRIIKHSTQEDESNL